MDLGDSYSGDLIAQRTIPPNTATNVGIEGSFSFEASSPGFASNNWHFKLRSGPRDEGAEPTETITRLWQVGYFNRRGQYLHSHKGTSRRRHAIKAARKSRRLVYNSNVVPHMDDLPKGPDAELLLEIQFNLKHTD